MNTIETIIDMTINGPGDSDRHALVLFSLILQNKSKSVMELGVRSGRTTMPIFEACKITRASMISVDMNKPQFDYKILEEGYPNFKFVLSDSIIFLEKCVSNKVYFDFVFVDDWHDGIHVRRELDLLDALTDNKSLIVLHDLMYNNSQPYYNTSVGKNGDEFGNGGPFFAVNSLDKNVWEWCTIPVNNGLTILRKKE
jgi:predicted O-methyltransferase YrrM